MNEWQQGPRTTVGYYWLYRKGWPFPVPVQIYEAGGVVTPSWWGMRYIGTDEDEFHSGEDSDYFLSITVPAPPQE